MATTDLTLAAETSGPSIVLQFPGVDLTGHSLRMSVFWRGGGFELTSTDGDLTLAITEDAGVTTSRVTWAYTVEQSSGMPYGAVAIYDLFATLSETQKISAGQINVDGPGRLSVSAGAVVEIPGIQGPRGWSPVYGTPTYGTSVVFRVTDWIGGVGTKPATGQYLGPDGYVDDIADATPFASAESALAAIEAAAESAASAVTAAASEVVAVSAQSGSQAARVASEAARDAAFVNANVYADEATGRAAVADGVQFQVVSVDGLTITRYRRVNSSSSVVVATYPSKLALDSIFSTERVVLSRNLLDITDLTFERAAHNTNTLSVSATQDCTNFIRVVPGRQYYFRQSLSYRHAILGFTSRVNSSNIGRVGSAGSFGAYTFTMPSGVIYVKVGLVGSGETRDSGLFSQFSLSEGDFLPTTDMLYSGYYSNTGGSGRPFSITSGAISEIVEEFAASANLLDYSKIIIGLSVSPSAASLSGVSGSSVSDLIPCAANEAFVFGGMHDSLTRRVLYYDDAGTPIVSGSTSAADRFPGSGTDDVHVSFTVPDNEDIAAFRVQIHASDPAYTDRSDSYHVYKGEAYKAFMKYRAAASVGGKVYYPQQEVVEEYFAPYVRRPVSFADKNIYIMGDSITSNGVWVRRFANLIRPKTATNAGAGGMRFVNTNGVVNPSSYQNAGTDYAYQMAAAITAETLVAPDYMVCALGTNEFDKLPATSVAEANIDNAFTSGGATLSDLSSVDISKIPGAMRYIVETVGGVAPDMKFFFSTPIPNTATSWASQLAVSETIRWTAARMSIPVIDLHARSNILTLWDYPAGGSTYRNLVDGVHPFGGGVVETPATKMIAEQMASEFLNYVIVSP